MSADNGIYILKTKDQYRVTYAHAIDNLWWSFLKWDSDRYPVPTRIVEIFGGVRYTRSYEIASKVASAMERYYKWTEYGFGAITVDKTWKQIVYEAKNLAPKEIESIKNRGIGNWDNYLESLEKIISA